MPKDTDPSPLANSDPSNGWDAVAEQFMQARSDVGADLVRHWAQSHLPPGAALLDVGCGSGVPIAQALIEAGFAVHGIDPSPTLVAAFRRHFPDAPCLCEAGQDSTFFNGAFDAAIAIGVVFLLTPAQQQRLLRNMIQALKPGGRVLFTAPAEPCHWTDALTGLRSESLGLKIYTQWLTAHGMRLDECHLDAGGNHYFDACKPMANAHTGA